MAPIVPGFSTQPAKIERTIKAIADSGATSSRYVRKDYEKRVQEAVTLMRQRYGVGKRPAARTTKAAPAAEEDLRLLQPEE